MLDPVKIFSVYSRKDKVYLEEFKKNLTPLIRDKVIEFWHDQEIKPGEVWESIIKSQLAKADIIILLISSDFLSSDFINSNELPNAFLRREKGEVEIIPIIARNCVWQTEKRISQLQVLPTDALPIAEWDHKDKVYTIISQQLIDFIDKIRIKKAFFEGVSFDSIQVYNEKLLYDFFIEHAYELVREQKFISALHFYEQARIKYKEGYSFTFEYLDEKISFCEQEIYKEVKARYESLLSEAKNYECINWPEALKKYKESLNEYRDGFDPAIDFIKEKISYCKNEIAGTPKKSLKTQDVFKKYTRLIDYGESRFISQDYDSALNSFEEALQYCKPSFSPGRDYVKEKIINIENILFLQHKEKVMKFYNEKKYKDALNEYKTAILYQSDDVLYTALHKLVDNEETFFNQLEILIESNRNLTPEILEPGKEISDPSVIFLVVCIFPFFTYIYVLITYCMFHQELNFPYFNFVFTILHSGFSSLLFHVTSLAPAKKLFFFFIHIFLSIYLIIFFQHYYLEEIPFWKIFGIGQVWGNIHKVIKNCYIGYWSFILEIFTLLIMPFMMSWDELFKKNM